MHFIEEAAYIACVAGQFQRTDRYNQAYENFIK
jgi:hypothetical protein